VKSLTEIRTELAAALGGSLRGVGVEYLPQVDSTSTELKRRLKSGRLEGVTVLTTDNQTSGRGTHGRSWIQQSGRDLALSIAVPGDVPGWLDQRLPLMVGAAAALSLEYAVKLDDQDRWVRLSWPNDLCLGDPPLKFGGLLAERSGGWVFLGIGLNLNSSTADLGSELSKFATTLSEQMGRQLDRTSLTATFVAGLLQRLGLLDPRGITPIIESLLEQWRQRDCTKGKAYKLAATGELIRVQSVEIASGELICLTERGREVRVVSYRELLAIPY